MNEVDSLKAIINELLTAVAQLQVEVASLKAELAIYKNPKNSRNSSLPPSKDENRAIPNQSLRTKSDKKVGGQPGHKGHTLEMSQTPNAFVVLQSNTCSACGNNITALTPSAIESRQVIDIPAIVPIITEYQSFSKICSCGHCNKAVFPLGVEAPVQYGSMVESMVVYLHTRQYMPFNRIKEYFATVFQIPFSEGTIQNILKRMYQKALPVYERIKATLGQATYAGGDETSVRINGEKGWFWTLQNDQYTLIHCSDNRGFATLNHLYPHGLPNTIIGHDAYSAWFKLIAKGHQLCLAHLQRELNYFEELHPNESWIRQIKVLFYQAIAWK
jgi:transposase